MMAKPIKTSKLHYTMIQFLVMINILHVHRFMTAVRKTTSPIR